ncbi:MAG TPA: cytochrome c biogenesis protein CcdA [Edaphocola sp.]|nr:cytochrome c biogenesis protein CcdA [Edaphocola sp.]
MKKIVLLLLSILFLSFGSEAQIIKDPTTWTYEVKKTKDNVYDLIFKVKLTEGWHLWAFDPGGDGFLIPPSFDFDKNADIKFIGKTREIGKKISKDFDGEPGDEHFFEGKVTYIQTIEAKKNTVVKGSHIYQTCDDSRCLSPVTKKFSFEIKDVKVALIDTIKSDTAVIAPISVEDTAKSDTAVVENNSDTTGNATVGLGSGGNDGTAINKDGENSKSVPSSLLMIFLAGLGAGLLAVLTPCIYSMIPITISFFTKKVASRSQGIKNAMIYSFSIIAIFTALGLGITAIFGANALNNLATNWIANLVFFAIFLLFAFSFLGAFELTLPSSWTNKLGTRSNANSYGGIFFMALTLVIVSFSCTSAFIGGLAVLASKGGRMGPLVGFSSFGLGIALPFAIFALFPSYLKNLEKPGGWQNSLKVTLGFLELALALKFLSNADLAKGWRLLDREVFIALWAIIFVLLGLYLIGKLTFFHDSELPKNHFGISYISTPRIMLAISSFAFALYMIPGMWGAPLKALSSFVPPMGTQDFIMGINPSGGEAASDYPGPKPVKYVDKLKIYEPEIAKKNGLVTYFDLDEAKAASKQLKRPIMLDFTGITCINCRKMEGKVWSDPEVMRMLKEDFIVASLYCDFDNEVLPIEEQYYSKILGSNVKTVGDKNEDFQATKYNSNTQPFYFFIDENEVQLHPKGYDYDPSVPNFIAHLKKVIKKYKELKP